MILAVALSVSAGCAALGGTMLDAARKTFLGAADKNYGDAYHEQFDQLLGIITKPAEKALAPTPGPTQSPATDAVVQTPTTTPNSGGGPAPTPTNTTPAVAPVVNPTPASNPAAPLEFEFALLKQESVGGREVLVPVRDGDTLYDEFGTHGEGDSIKLTFRSNVECYVYVIAIDSTAYAQPVFPSTDFSGHKNPVQPGITYQIPGGSQVIPLDSYRGVEHLYVLASRTPRHDLEAQLQAMAGFSRPADPARRPGGPGDAVAMASVQTDAPLTRGLGHVRESKIQGVQSQQSTSAVEAQVFGARADGDILVTRWFRHE